MPWGRIDDSLYDHPKVDALPLRIRNACIGLWIRSISWSNRYLTDGAVPTERLRKLDGRTADIAALVDVGMFDRTESGVLIHDFLSFNDSAADVRQRRTEMRELGKRGGIASGEARRSSVEVKRDGSAPRLNSRPVPSLPNPSSPVPSGSTPSKNGDETTTTTNFRDRMTELGVKG